ncbi:MAG: hypothetical protein ACLFVF_07990 [Thiohalospira sp.]
MSRNRFVKHLIRALPLAALFLTGCAGLQKGAEEPADEAPALEQGALLTDYRNLLALSPARAEERLRRLEPAAGECDRDRLHQAMLRTHPAVELPEPATVASDFEPCRAEPPGDAGNLVAVLDTQLRRASRDAAEIRMLEEELTESREDLEALKELERRLMERGDEDDR